MTEWNAADYSRHSSLQEAMAQEVLALLDLKDSKRILDVGCGDGKITAEIAARSPQGSVVGVDPSRDMIAFAQSHFGPATRPNLRFEVADARSLTFKQEFDLVVSFNALHWIPEQDAALASIHSALISDGRAQLRLVVAGTRKSLEYVVEETRQTSKWSAYFQDFYDPYLRLTSDEYAAMAKRNAFRVLWIWRQRIMRGILGRARLLQLSPQSAASNGRAVCPKPNGRSLSTMSWTATEP